MFLDDDKIFRKKGRAETSFGWSLFPTVKRGDLMAVAVNYKEKLKNKDLDSFFRNADDQNAEEAMS